jgi:hypothetical protein
MNGLIGILNNVRSKIDVAAGAAVSLELHLRIIAQKNPRVQRELLEVQTSKGKKGDGKKRYHQADLSDLLDAIIEVFQNKLDLKDQELLKNCRILRNKTSHGSFAELMIALSGEAQGRETDPLTTKRKSLKEDDIIEGVICIEWNGGLEKFSQQANRAIDLLREKILPSLDLQTENTP